MPLKLVEDTASGKASWRERAIGEILEKAVAIVVAEVSRLGRSTLQVLEILETAAQKSISVHIAKNHMIMDGSMQATITATILGLLHRLNANLFQHAPKKP